MKTNHSSLERDVSACNKFWQFSEHNLSLPVATTQAPVCSSWGSCGAQQAPACEIPEGSRALLLRELCKRASCELSPPMCSVRDNSTQRVPRHLFCRLTRGGYLVCRCCGSPAMDLSYPAPGALSQRHRERGWGCSTAADRQGWCAWARGRTGVTMRCVGHPQ